MSDRLDEIKVFINNNKKDTFHDLLLQYQNELSDYDYIENLSDFSVLQLKGSLRYINKYSKELRFGGLLISIYEKYGNYFAMVKKPSGKIYNISFNNNFIFYKKSSEDTFRDSLKYFISNVDDGIYDK